MLPRISLRLLHLSISPLRSLSTVIQPLSHPRADIRSRVRLMKALAQLDEETFCFSPASFASLLQFCGNSKLLHEGKRIHDHLQKMGCDTDPYIGSFLVQLYVKCDQLSVARGVLATMEYRSVYLYNYMIGSYSKQGFPDEARFLSSQMISEGLIPDRVTCVNIISLYTGHGMVQHGRRLHACVFYLRLHRDLVLSTALIGLYGKHAQIEEAIHVFDGMSDRNVVSWNAMIGACFNSTHGAKPLQLFEQILHEGLLPDKITYINIISGCAETKAFSTGRMMHARIAQSQIEVDVKVASALINMYGKCDQIKYGKCVFEMLPCRNLFCWNTMISAYVQHGCTKEALELFQFMKQEGVSADKVTWGSILSAHAQCDQLDDARCILKESSDCNAICWNTVLSILVQQAKDEKVVDCFAQMQTMEVPPDEITFCHILTTCANQVDIEFGKRLHAQILRYGYDIDVHVGNALINLYGKCGCLDEAWVVFQGLIARDVVSWNTMITAYSQQGWLKGALQMFEQMKLEAMIPDTVTFVNILEAVSRLLILGERMHATIVYSEYRSEDAVVTALINMYRKSGKPEVIIRLFDDLSENTIAAWNAMICLYVQQGRYLHVLQVLEGVMQVGLIPNGVTYVNCLSACACLPAFCKGEQIYAQIVTSALGADVLVGTALVNLFSRCGRLVDARSIFEEMPNHDVAAWNVMIAAYAQHGCCKEVLDMIFRMLKRGLFPDSTTFVHTLSSCSHAGFVDDGGHVLDSMKRKYGVRPSLEHYDCMVDLFARAGRLEEAEDLVKRMPFKPSMVSWTTFLGFCRNEAGVEEAGDEAADSMVEIDPGCTSPYVTMWNICTKAEDEGSRKSAHVEYMSNICKPKTKFNRDMTTWAMGTTCSAY